MEIIDAQIHFGPEDLSSIIPVLDALGISGAILDEYWGYGICPGHVLSNGSWRLKSPSAEIISTMHPGRFTYLQRINIADPELETVICLLGQSPAARAVRVTPGLNRADLDAFARGEYIDAFRMAVEADLAIFVMVQGHVRLLEPYLSEFPTGRFILDHCGMPLERTLVRSGSSIEISVEPGAGFEYFDEVLALARWPNLAFKWAHAHGMFGEIEFPFAGLTRYLRRAIDAFGAERVIWAADASVIADVSWADLLFFVKSNPALSTEEKTWVLGGSARRWLKWERDL